MTINNRLPYGGDILIKFNHYSLFYKILKQCCKADDASTSERLNQKGWFWMTSVEPAPKGWNKPCFSARISERTPFGNGGHVHRFSSLNGIIEIKK